MRREINFLDKRGICAIISVILVVCSLIYIWAYDIPKNVDFEGGSKLTVVFNREDVAINQVRDAVTRFEPKASIVSEQGDDGTSRFSLKIKNPEVEEGAESDASLNRRRNLEKAFASINDEERKMVAKIAAMEEIQLAGRFLNEDIYGIEGTDEAKKNAYDDLAAKVKSAAVSASSVDELAQIADPDQVQRLAIALTSEIVPSLNRETLDAIGARLTKVDPLNRGSGVGYTDVVGVIETTRKENNDFIANLDELNFAAVLGDDQGNAVRAYFENNFILGQYNIVANETFSPSIAAELVARAENAIFLALIGILIYIAMRFDSNYAISSVVALAHDVIIALGVFALAGRFIGVELSNPVIAAFLTIVGYSLNDTIVVFDRIRDNRADIKHPDLVKIMNTSINQTLSRTLVTSLTTLFVVLVIYFGSNNATLRDFSFPLIIGILVGTYSSIFVASPFLLFLTEKQVLKRVRAAISFSKKPARA